MSAAVWPPLPEERLVQEEENSLVSLKQIHRVLFVLCTLPRTHFQHKKKKKKLRALSGFRTKMATRPFARELCLAKGWVGRVCCLASTARTRLDIGPVVGALGEHQGPCHQGWCLDYERGERAFPKFLSMVFH